MSLGLLLFFQVVTYFHTTITNADNFMHGILSDFPKGYPPVEWVHVDDGHFWIYGAFWDTRHRANLSPDLVHNRPYIRIYIVGPYRYQRFISELSQSYCEFSYLNTTKTELTKILHIQLPTMDWNNPRSMSIHFFVYCNVPILNNIPQAVSIKMMDSVTKKWRADFEGRRRNFLLPIRGQHLLHQSESNDKIITVKKTLAMCIKPFLGNWANKDGNGFFSPLELILNFFVYYSSMGVEHFTLYDQGTATAPVYQILSVAAAAGIAIDILPWNFRERQGYGMFQTLSIETCLHRYMGRFSNVLVGDFDELIVPKHNSSLLQLIQHLDSKYPKASHYKFSSTNFYSYLPDSAIPTDTTTMATSSRSKPLSPKYHSIIKDLMILRKFNRTVPYPFTRGTKCMVKPDRIAEAGIHDALPLSASPGTSSSSSSSSSYHPVEVSFEAAAVHHYREEVVNPAERQATDIFDFSMMFLIDRFYSSSFYNLARQENLFKLLD